ncbi:MAG: ATP-binding protein [Acidobacteriota bacterium]
MLSLRAKLTLWYLALVSLVLVIFGMAIYFYLSYSLLRIIDVSLLGQAELLARNYPANNQAGNGEKPQSSHSTTTHVVPQFVQFVEPNGEVVDEITDANGHSLPLMREMLTAAGPRLDTLTIGSTEQVRVATWPLHSADGDIELYIRVGQSLLDLQQAQQRLLRLLGVSLPLALVLASMGGLWLAEKALRPVEQVSQAARQIGASNLKERVAVPKAGDEISRLASLFNEMIERLERAFERERRFTADASHELRTPLAILRGEIEIALRKERTSEQYKEVLSASLEEIVRLSKLVDDLLTLARSESGELVLERAEVQLDQLAVEICQYVAPLAEAKGLALEYTPPSYPIKLIGDARRLRQLLLNLLDNAIKYTPAGGQVHLRVEENAANVGIEIEDNGYGIPAEEQPLIFERFYRRKHTNTAETGGFGLGLAICKWIAEAHGGQLAVISEPGRGSQFRASFPRTVC